MGAQSDQVKGRAKEAAGILTGNDDLGAEGKTDRLAADAQEKIDHLKEKAEEMLDTAKDRSTRGSTRPGMPCVARSALSAAAAG